MPGTHMSLGLLPRLPGDLSTVSVRTGGRDDCLGTHDTSVAPIRKGGVRAVDPVDRQALWACKRQRFCIAHTRVESQKRQNMGIGGTSIIM